MWDLWALERILWGRCTNFAFVPSIANNITLFRGRLALFGLVSLNMLYAFVHANYADAGLLRIIAILALVVFSMSAIMDITDGMVARLSITTETGRCLDIVADSINVFWSFLMLVQVCNWPLWEVIVPAIGITCCGMLVFCHRARNGAIETNLSAKVSQVALYAGISVFVAALIGGYENALGIGAMLMWIGFALKIFSTLAYFRSALVSSTPARAS